MGSGLGENQKMWDPLLISATVEDSNFKFGTQLVFEEYVAINNFYDQIWRGSGLGEHPENFGIHLFR